MSEDSYGAFISYSRTASTDLAVDLQTEVERFAKPWNRLRAIRIFRDDSTMPANSSLWDAIAKGLQQSKWFILIATPEAAASEYVNKEVAWWLSNREAARVLLVHAGGELSWDRDAGDFSASSTAIPPALRRAFRDEPRWVDLRWYAEPGSLKKGDPRFSERVADLAAAIRGIERDSLIGENVRQHQLRRRLTRAAITGLSALLVATIAAATIAVTQTREAVRQRNAAQEQALVATVRQLAGTAENLAASDLEEALLLADTAYRTRQEAQTVRALHAVLSTTPQLVGFSDVGEPVTVVDGTPNGRLIVAGTSSGMVLLIDRDSGERSELMRLTGEVDFLAVSEDGTTVAASWSQQNENGLTEAEGSAIWSDGEITEIPERLVALSPGGSTVAFSTSLETDSMLGDSVIGVIMDGERREITTSGPATSWVGLPNDSQLVAMNAHGGFTRAWLDSGRVDRTTIPMGSWFAGGAIAQDGGRFTFSNGGHEIEVWDLRGPFGPNQSPVDGELSGLTGNPHINDIALNLDGSVMATASTGSIYVSDVQPIGQHTTGATELRGAGDQPHSLRFLSNDLLVSASRTSVALWDLTRTTPLATSITRPLDDIDRTCAACGPLKTSFSPNGAAAVIGEAGFRTTVANLATGYTRSAPVYPPPTDPADRALNQMQGSIWLDDERAVVWARDGHGWVLGGDNLSDVQETLSLPPAIDRVVVRDEDTIVLLANGNVQTMELPTWKPSSESAAADLITTDGMYAVRIAPADNGASTDVEALDTMTLRSVVSTQVEGRVHTVAEHTGPDEIALLRFVEDDTELVTLDVRTGSARTIGRLGVKDIEFKNVTSSSTMLAVEDAGLIWLYSLLDASHLKLIPVESGLHAWNSLGFNRDSSILVIASEPANELIQVPVTSRMWSRTACHAAGRSIKEDELLALVGSIEGLVLGCATDGSATRSGEAEQSEHVSPPQSPESDGAAPTPSSESSGWDVSAHRIAEFASPSGRIQCGIVKGKATCGFSSAMPLDLRPPAEQACPTEKGYGAAGVSVNTEVRWVCAGGLLFWPVEDSSATEWATQYPAGRSDSGDGQPGLVTLPYGESLRNGDILCTSREEGMTCENTSAGAGFTVSSSGITTADDNPPSPFLGW